MKKQGVKSGFLCHQRAAYGKLSLGVFKNTLALAAIMLSHGPIAWATTCEFNGRVVPCDQMPVWFIPTMLGFFGLMFLLFGFWLWMFIHCLTTPIEDKLLWGVVILFAGPLGAILYYFIVKRRH